MRKWVGIVIFFISGLLYGTPHELPTFSFVENKGQWESQILYKSQLRGGALFFENKAVTYSFFDNDYLEKVSAIKTGNKNIVLDSLINVYSYRVNFLGATSKATVFPEREMSEYHNYFLGNDPSRWKSNVALFEQITYRSLYDGIDLKYYQQNGTYKYDFIVAPHASVSQITMNYEGVDKLSLKYRDLEVRVGKFKALELTPYAYQIGADGEKEEVPCDFVIDGNTVCFKLGQYDEERVLIIDPSIVFASYSGSTADNWGYTATYDAAGNMYGGGTVYGMGYPTTIGAYQTTYGGSACDIAITKFNTLGTARIYSTYLGGSNTDIPHSLVVNSNNELYVLGTTSSSNFPITSGCFDSSFSGGSAYVLTAVNYYSQGSDIIISRFSASGGQLLSSTFFGGTGNDGLNTNPTLKVNYSDEVRGGLQVDKLGNIVVVSSTNSSNMPITAGAFQTTMGLGAQSGIVAKFSYNLQNLLWCSYFGGSGNDAVYSIEIDRNNNIVICGGTNSNNLPTTAGAYQSTYNGAIDGFVAVINASGTNLLHCTYLGTNTYDQAYLVKLDKNNDIYVTGQTNAPATSWIYNATWSSGMGQYVIKLSSDLTQRIWSTSFGNALAGYDISPTALLIDACDNVHVSGWGGLTNNTSIVGMPTTADAFKITTDGNDFYFITIGKDAQQLVFASYFGGSSSGEHVDGGTSRFDNKGIIYQAVCAGCQGRQDFPVTSGVVGPSNNSTNCNLGVVKIEFNLHGIIADFNVPTIVCAPTTLSFDNTSLLSDSSNTTFFWDFGDGDTSNLFAPSHSYTQSGQYVVTLIIEDTNSCNKSDTFSLEILVLSNTIDTLPVVNVCAGNQVQIGLAHLGENVSYQWNPSSGLSDATVSNPIINDPVDGWYELYISNGTCTDTLRQQVNVYDLPKGKLFMETVCYLLNHQFVGDTAGATTFHWSSNLAFSDTLNASMNDPSLTISIDSNVAQRYYLKRGNGYCQEVDTFYLRVSFLDISIDSLANVCFGDTLAITVSVNFRRFSNDVSYNWSFPNGSFTTSADGKTVYMVPTSSGQLTIAAANEHGCVYFDTCDVVVTKLQASILTTDAKCFGEANGTATVSVSGGSGNYLCQWTSLDSTLGFSKSNLLAGTYTLTLIDATSGCNIDTTFMIGQPTKLNLSIRDKKDSIQCGNYCDGMFDIAVSGGVFPYTYLWSNGDTTPLTSGLCIGNYDLLVTDAHGCQDSILLEIFDTSKILFTYDETMPSCLGSCDGSISLNVSGASMPYFVTWNNGYTSLVVNNLCAGTYSVQLVDAKDCRRSANIVLNNPPAVGLVIKDFYQPSCTGDNDGYLKVVGTGGTSPYQYLWGSGSTSDSLGGLSAGSYSISITDAHGCKFDTVLVLNDFLPIAATGFASKIPCEEVCNAVSVIEVQGGRYPYHYQWGNDVLYDSIVGNLCLGTYQVKVLDSNGCQTMLTIVVQDSSTFPQSVVAWADSIEIYRSLSVLLKATSLGSGFSYRWEPSDCLSSSTDSIVLATPTEETVFTVTVSDIYGCTKTDTVRIKILDVICEDPYVFVPNAFSPNNDGNNDLLYVRGDLLVEVDFAVYDRWGERLFATKDKNKGWNGTYKGKDCSPGVYVYYLQATCLGGIQYVHKGNVTLIR